MDISRAIQFITDDEQWIKKILIGGVVVLLSIFIIPIFALTGYAIQIARNVKDGMDVPLPEWDDWGKYLKDGFVVAMAGFIYALPALILIIVGVAITGIGDATDIDAIAATGGVLLGLLSCIAFLWLLALVAIGPAIYIQYIEHGTLGACLQVSEVINITRSNIGDILISVAVIMGLGIVTSLVTAIPCLGLIVALFTTPYLQFVSAHLYGQIAAKVHGKGSKFDDIVIN